MDTDAAETLLAERENALRAQMTQMSAPPEDVGTISFGKRVGEGTAMAVDRLIAVSTHAQLREQLEEIQTARARIAEGTYGTCAVCGREIPEGRLEARPWSVRCVRCSARE